MPIDAPRIPTDVPEVVTRTIVYAAKPVQARNPWTGDPTTVRSQVRLQILPNVTVEEFVPGGKAGNDRIVALKFGPPQGWKEAIRSSMLADDPTLPIIKEAWEQKTTVTVAVETHRWHCVGRSDEKIGPWAQINGLRGFDVPEGIGNADTGFARERVTNTVAAVNGYATQEIVSDPTEWGKLANNEFGFEAPPGWVYYGPKQAGLDVAANPDAWKQVGCLVKDDGATVTASGSGAGFNLADPETAAAFKDLIRVALQEHADNKPRSGPETFFEAAYQDHTSSGHLSLAGQGLGGDLWMRRWVDRYVKTTRFESLGIPVPQVNPLDEPTVRDEITSTLLQVCDTAQVAAYQHPKYPRQGRVHPDLVITANRKFGSWRTVADEVKHQIVHDEMLAAMFPWAPVEAAPEGQDDTERAADRSAWCDALVGCVVDVLVAAAIREQSRLQDVAGKVKTGRAKAKQRREEQRVPHPTGPSPKKVEALVGMIARSWDNLEVLGRAFTIAADDGLLEVGVSQPDPASAPVFPPADGAATLTIRECLLRRKNVLTAAAADTSAAPADSAVAAEPATVAGTDQSAETAPAITATEDTTATTKNGDREAVSLLVKTVAGTADMETVNRAHATAQQGNLLGFPVTVDPNTMFETSGPGYSTTLGEVLQEKARRLSTPRPDQGVVPAAAPRTAQQIADAATQALTQAPAEKAVTLTALRDEAVAGGHEEARITIGGRNGSLISYLDACSDRKAA